MPVWKSRGELGSYGHGVASRARGARSSTSAQVGGYLDGKPDRPQRPGLNKLRTARVIEEGGPGLAVLPELLLPKLLEAFDACFGLVVEGLQEDVRKATFSSETAQAVLLMMRDAVALRTKEVPRLRALWLRLFGGSDGCET